MKNQQRPVPRVVTEGAYLKVHSIFPTIQGEGPHAGRKALFVRLADCNLQCPLCDTEYTEGGIGEVCYSDLAKRVRDSGHKLVVITGGEPLRQNLVPFLGALRGYGIRPQIETNGKLPPQSNFAFLTMLMQGKIDVVISPKTHTIDARLARYATAFKYVVQLDDVAEDGLPIHALGHPVPLGKTIARPPEGYTGPIYIQPADEQDEVLNELNNGVAVASVLEFDDPRRILCLQMHKYMGLD